MADLVEANNWDVGIYQLETVDPVEGGPGGIDNRQAQALANRTKYLKAQQEAHAAAADPHPQYMTTAESDAAIAAAVAALVASSPAALDTLAEFATALGSDPNFATTITNLLALKAPLASPVFTGNPTGPTPLQFDSSTKLATMEAIQRAIGNIRSTSVIAAVTTLVAGDAGKAYTINNGGFTTTLPLCSALVDGASFLFTALSDACVVSAQGANVIYSGQGTVTSFNLNNGDSLLVVCNGGAWVAHGGSAPLSRSALFSSTKSQSGYQKLPSGLIIQWGQASIGSNTTVPFPISFPTACLQVVITDGTSAAQGCGASALTASNFRADSIRHDGIYTVTTTRYIAIGY